MNTKEIFSKNLRYYVERSGKTQIEIAESLGMSKGTLSKYVNGVDIPRMNRIQKIADYFGISKADLIEGVPEKEKENRVISDAVVKMSGNKDYYAIVEMLNGCDDSQLKRMLAYFELLNNDLKK